MPTRIMKNPENEAIERGVNFIRDINFLRAFVSAIPIGIVVCDPQGHIRFVNQEVLKLFGYSEEEVIDHPIEMLMPSRYQATHPGMMRAFFVDPTARPMGAGRDLFAACKDGREFPVEIGLMPFETQENTYVIATVVDITQRRNSEKLLQKSRNLFNAVVEAAPTGIVMVDQYGRIGLVNCLIERLFGYARDDMIGQPIEMLMPARIRAAHPEMMKGFFVNPTARPMGAGRDLFAARHDGTEFPVEIGLSPVILSDGHYVLATIVDISGRKNEEQKLRRANENLEEFVYVASHDLRAPLRGISDLLEWIQEDLAETPNPKISQNVDRTKIRIARLERLIDDLLSYARAGMVNKSFVFFKVKDMINTVLELQPLRAGFEIRLEIDDLEMLTGKTALETVLRNLIANAVKHHDLEAGMITVAAHAKGEFIEFSVSDDGPGISSQVQDRIFKLFQTASANNQQQNSGVGLAISKRTVEAYGGWIVVESTDGCRGTTFRFFLASYTDSIDSNKECFMNNHQFTILLIDDDDVAIESAQRNLRKCGIDYPVLTAGNGKEGLAVLRGESTYGKMPTELVVLLDLNMPVTNGFEFLEELRSDPKLRSTVVFVLTTSDSDTDRTRAYHNCIAGYMVKSALGYQFAQLANLLSVYKTTISFS